MTEQVALVKGFSTGTIDSVPWMGIPHGSARRRIWKKPHLLDLRILDNEFFFLAPLLRLLRLPAFVGHDLQLCFLALCL